eukprot:5244960-Pyramimonas_sp.AAC.1
MLLALGRGCERFSVATRRRHLGISVGTDARLHSFPAQQDKLFRRVREIRLVGVGLAESIVAHTVRAVQCWA